MRLPPLRERREDIRFSSGTACSGARGGTRSTPVDSSARTRRDGRNPRSVAAWSISSCVTPCRSTCASSRGYCSKAASISRKKSSTRVTRASQGPREVLGLDRREDGPSSRDVGGPTRHPLERLLAANPPVEHVGRGARRLRLGRDEVEERAEHDLGASIGFGSRLRQTSAWSSVSGTFLRLAKGGDAAWPGGINGRDTPDD